jgi:hypothetical protein
MTTASHDYRPGCREDEGTWDKCSPEVFALAPCTSSKSQVYLYAALGSSSCYDTLLVVDIMTKRAGSHIICPERKALKRTRTARIPKLPLPLYTASIKELAETNTDKDTVSTADVDSAILLQIKKCLDRANHPGTAELEAKAAFHLASRLMGQYNVSQAEVLAHEPAAIHRQYAGESVVSIKRIDGDQSKTVKHQSYVDNLCHAMGRFFDCEFYSTSTPLALEMTFYGIAENTVAAAIAFEIAYNLVTEWARSRRGAGCKNSYCRGASDELNRLAKREKEAEEVEAKNAEVEAMALKMKKVDVERWLQLSSLAPPESPGTCSSPEPAWAGESIDNDGKLSQHADSGVKWSDWLTEDGLRGVCGTDFTEENASDRGGEDTEPAFMVEPEDGHSPFGGLDEDIARPIKRGPSEDLVDICSPLLSHAPLPARVPAEYGAAGVYTVTMDEVVKTTPKLYLLPQLPWTSHTQLINFRATAAKIADEHLRDKGVNFCRRSAKPSANAAGLPTIKEPRMRRQLTCAGAEKMSGRRIRNSE